MAKKDWYCYIDETRMRWRIQTTAQLAEIGGLSPTDESAYPPLSDLIKPRYVWLQEWPRPKDRLSARQKIILAPDRLKDIWQQPVKWQIAGKELVCVSYYGDG